MSQQRQCDVRIAAQEADYDEMEKDGTSDYYDDCDVLVDGDALYDGPYDRDEEEWTDD